MMSTLPSNQPTMPNPALQPRGKTTRVSQPTVRRAVPVVSQPQRASAPVRPQPRPSAPLRPAPRKSANRRWLWVMALAFVGMMFACVGTLAAGMMVFYGQGILPAVSVSGVDLGGLSRDEAVASLNRNWRVITLRDGARTWSLDASALGIILDASATADRAYAVGRSTGNPINAIFGHVSLSPVVSVNTDVASAELNRIIGKINIPPIDASVGFEGGRVVALPPQNGKSLDISATLNQFAQTIQTGAGNGELELVMVPIAPAIQDVSGIVAQAQALLSNPLDIRVYDPVTGDSVYWSAMPDVWGEWLAVSTDTYSAIGLRLDANPDAVRAYLNQQAQNVLDSTRTLDIESGVESVVQAIGRGQPSQGFVQVKHKERIHTVQAGETITSIAWDYGIPYLYIQNLNNGVTSLSAGQQIKIPPADVFLTEPVNPSKRIVVSIGEQKVRVYENDQLKWDWLASTGISDSPTWTGVYQILSHVDNAYAANWNLYMPNFMGVYYPVPNSEFTNGFHGFPTRGGGQLLWENSLGRKVTYGCILLHNNNMQQLYQWAEEGVVVEIQA